MDADRATHRAVAARLAAAGVGSPDHDARLLIEAAHDGAALETLVARRASREPLQHLTGVAYFRHLELAVGPGVFVPRPETELLAQAAIDALRPGDIAVDLCAGSGAVALALATEAQAIVHAVELSDAAMPYLLRNVDAVSPRGVTVHHADATSPAILDDVAGEIAVVVSNPPYIPDGMVPRDPEVREHDPHLALFGGADGLDVARGVVATAARLLRDGGLLAMEHADVQGHSVLGLFDGGWAEVADHADYNGLPRFVTARRVRMSL